MKSSLYKTRKFLGGWYTTVLGFPGGTEIKNLPASAGYSGDIGSIPGSGRSPREGNGNPLQYSFLGNPMDCSLSTYVQCSKQSQALLLLSLCLNLYWTMPPSIRFFNCAVDKQQSCQRVFGSLNFEPKFYISHVHLSANNHTRYSFIHSGNWLNTPPILVLKHGAASLVSSLQMGNLRQRQKSFCGPLKSQLSFILTIRT